MTRGHRACTWGSLTPPQPRANLAGSLVTALTLRMVLFLSLPSAFRRRWLAVVRSLALLTFATNSLLAQAVSGVGDDAIPIVKGSVRYSVAATWNQWGSVFATDAQGRFKRQPLLNGVATGNLGTAALPQLSATEQAIRTLSGRTDFSLSLGTLEANGIVRQTVVPFSVDVGLTRRLSIGLVVPYVESKQSTQLVLNRSGTGATVGQNPTYLAIGGNTARAANGLLLLQLSQARAQLIAEITRCVSSTALGCDAIRAGGAAAQLLVQQALTTQNALAAVYGDSVRGGAPVVPISGSALQTTINTALGSLRTAFAGFGINSIAATSLPVSATIISGPGSLAKIAGDSAYGLGYTDLGGKRRAGIGDVDLTATLLLYDTFAADQRTRLLNRGRGVRSSLSGGWRFGSAGGRRIEDPFDIPIGDGANALLLRSTTDLMFNHRYWMSATVRVVHPLSDNVTVSLPLRPDPLVFAAFTRGIARRSLGQRAEIELAPRLVLGDFFGVSAAYMYRSVSQDVFTVQSGVDATTSVAASTTTAPSRSFQAASLGLTYSSLNSYARGRSRYPVEVRFMHIEPLSASGGVVPAVSTDRLELRVFTGFIRR